MTPQEFIQSNNQLIKILSDAKFMLPIIQGTHNKQVERIFDKGIAGDGVKIGDYSNEKTGLYINPRLAIGSFTGEGKNGDKKFKNGTEHKTKYFDNYKAYRNEVKKETSFVNFRMTENLKIDFSNSLRFAGEGRVTSSVHGQRNVKILEGQSERFGKRAFQLTDKEQLELNDKFGKAYLNNLKK